MFWEFYLIVNIKMMRVKRFFLTHDFFADMKPDAIGHKTTLRFLAQLILGVVQYMCVI